MKKKYKKVEEPYERSVYMFHNTKHNLYLFTTAQYYEGAMGTFALCNFKDREAWKIFLEGGSQPA